MDSCGSGKSPVDAPADGCQVVDLTDASKRAYGDLIEIRKLLQRCYQSGAGEEFQLELNRIDKSRKKPHDKKRLRDNLRRQMKRHLESEATQPTFVCEPPPELEEDEMPTSSEPQQAMDTQPDEPEERQHTVGCVPMQREPEQSCRVAPLTSPSFALQPGSRVILQGLRARPELNFTDALLLHYFEDRSRWGVRCVDGSQISVRRSLEQLTSVHTLRVHSAL